MQIFNQRRQPRGMILIWVVFLLMVLIAFLGLALDWGYLVWTGQKLQNAADAAALAGAQQISDGMVAVNDAAVFLAEENEAAGDPVALTRNDTDNFANGEIVVGYYDDDDRSFTARLSAVNAVRVLARRNDDGHGGVPLLFGPIFGKETANASRFAIAKATSGPSDAAVIALDPNDRKSFYLHGNPVLDLGDGAVQVNSNHASEAGLLQGTQAELIAGVVNLVGGFGTHGNPDTEFYVNEGAPYVNDPLAALPAPPNGPPGTKNGLPVNKISGSGTYTPGYYSQGLDLNSSEHAVLLPGIYVLGGNKAFTINGQARLTAPGVMFYIVSGDVHVNGGSDLRMTPPLTGTYQGISFFQARSNTKGAKFNGNGIMGGILPDFSDGTGVLYFPSALLEVGGTADTFVGKLIANNIEVYGNGTKTVVDGYETEEGTTLVYLVE